MEYPNNFSYEQLLNCAKGLLFGEGNAQLPHPPMLMFDRISNINNTGGLFQKGEVVALAESVMSGGNRRSALISLFSADDIEMCQCKPHEFWRTEPQRQMANNSAVILRNKIKRDYFKTLWKRIESNGTGEPGIYFSKDKDWGTNPCCEIALRPYQYGFVPQSLSFVR